jgi:putative ABC transport system substrate-binding protein
VKRRTFIAGLGSAAAWPVVARAQQGRDRRIGVLLNAVANDTEFQTRVGAFLQALAPLGWTIGRNVGIDIHWGTPNPAEIRRHASELAALAPDVVLANGAIAVGPLLEVTHSVPIVFVGVTDPIGSGLVDSMARPGGNATGFVTFEFSTSGKWVELLKQIAPSVTRMAILRSTNLGPTAQFGVIQAVAASLKVDVTPVNLSDADEIERAIATFSHAPNGGLVVTSSASSQFNHHAGGPTPIACGVSLPLLRHWRWPDLLWT